MPGLLLDRRFLLALLPGTALSALAIGIPTDVIPNPWFTRMTPVRTLDIVLLPLLSLALGALMATYALGSAGGGRAGGSLAGGGVLGSFAIGCPVCNKLVVLALGFSGALTYFEPVQPLLGFTSLAVAIYALRRRLRALAAGCAVALPGQSAAGNA